MAESSLVAAIAIVVAAAVGAWIWRVVEWVWLGPKRLERRLRKQGIRGHPYRVFHGDMKDIASMGLQATKTPMPSFSHHILPRIRPFLHRAFTNHGEVCMTWEGPVAMVQVRDAELAKQVLSNHYDFHKPTPNPLTAMLVRGVVSYDGPKWAHHRKLINPAFHFDKLKVPGEMSDISSDSSMSARIERLKAACRAYNGSPDSSRVQSFSKNPDEEATVELVYSEQGVEVDQPRKAPDVKVAPNPPQMPVQLPPKVPSPRLLPPSESPRPLPPSENRPSLKRPREVIVLSDSESDEI